MHFLTSHHYRHLLTKPKILVLTTAFKELYVAGASKDMLFQETSEDVQNPVIHAKPLDIEVMDMRWHDTGRTKDGKLKHLGDGLAWKAFNDRYPKFASNPHSVRLGLASDGSAIFYSFGDNSRGKGPGNDIDVYLQPLIPELNLLWKGVDAYDAFSKERFKLRASLLWTVNNFSAYANLSGWSTKRRMTCPTCANSTRSIWLKHGKKFCYMGHRRWLEENHPYRFQKDRFDGSIEVDGPPAIMSGSDILKQLRGSSFKYGKLTKSNNKRRRDDVGCSTSSPLPVTNDESSAFDDIESFIEEDIDGDNQLWKKRSIFFDLPYWEFNLIRHNLDVMHIEKNVFDNLIGTLLNLDGKTKDNENARLCAKVLDPSELDKMEYQVVRTLCELEQLFPPTFGRHLVEIHVIWAQFGKKTDKVANGPLVHIDIQLKDDPFIVSSQAKQVFYIEDVKDVGWLHVNMNYPRDTYDIGKMPLKMMMTHTSNVLFLPFKLLFLLFPDHLNYLEDV
ncbi:hypothetical protein Tco_0825556 [Tanacetum coccineum]